MYRLIQRWVSRHKALTAAIIAFFVTGSVGAVVYAQTRNVKRRRRARKSPSGARTDVVVIAGAVANPLTSALYLDLERRGFVVYVVTNTPDDELYVRSQSRSDVIPLSLDLVDDYTAQEQVSRFQHLLARQHFAFEGAEPHTLSFSGLILVPDTSSPPARIEDISSEEWCDALNAKVLNTIATTQLLLPAVIETRARILLLTPTVTPSLQLPSHGLESTVYGALHGFTSSLAAELRQEGLVLSHFKLGNIDIPAVTARQRREGVPAPRLKPTPLRTLHDSVFDTLVAKRPWRTQYIGRGSLTYDIIGSIVPPACIAWMMGQKARRAPVVEEMFHEDLQGSAGSLTWEKVGSEDSL